MTGPAIAETAAILQESGDARGTAGARVAKPIKEKPVLTSGDIADLASVAPRTVAKWIDASIDQVGRLREIKATENSGFLNALEELRHLYREDREAFDNRLADLTASWDEKLNGLTRATLQGHEPPFRLDGEHGDRRIHRDTAIAFFRAMNMESALNALEAPPEAALPALGRRVADVPRPANDAGREVADETEVAHGANGTTATASRRPQRQAKTVDEKTVLSPIDVGRLISVSPIKVSGWVDACLEQVDALRVLPPADSHHSDAFEELRALFKRGDMKAFGERAAQAASAIGVEKLHDMTRVVLEGNPLPHHLDGEGSARRVPRETVAAFFRVRRLEHGLAAMHANLSESRAPRGVLFAHFGNAGYQDKVMEGLDKELYTTASASTGVDAAATVEAMGRETKRLPIIIVDSSITIPETKALLRRYAKSTDVIVVTGDETDPKEFDGLGAKKALRISDADVSAEILSVIAAAEQEQRAVTPKRHK